MIGTQAIVLPILFLWERKSFETQCQDSGKSLEIVKAPSPGRAVQAAPLLLKSRVLVWQSAWIPLVLASSSSLWVSVGSGLAVAAVAVLRLLLLLAPSVVAWRWGSPVTQFYEEKISKAFEIIPNICGMEGRGKKDVDNNLTSLNLQIACSSSSILSSLSWPFPIPLLVTIIRTIHQQIDTSPRAVHCHREEKNNCHHSIGSFLALQTLR